MKQLFLRLTVLALLIPSALAGDAERQPDSLPAAMIRNSAPITPQAPSPAIGTAAISPQVPVAEAHPVAPAVVVHEKDSINLSWNLSGLFAASALFSLTLRFYLRRHRRAGHIPPALPRPLSSGTSAPLDLKRRKDHLMTPAERNFFAVLEPLVRPVCRISIKVRLADLFEVRPERGRQAAFNLISNKYIDFILTEHGTSRILCGIELDDRSHQRPDRVKRDAFVEELFASQQLPLVRVPCARRYDSAALHETLASIFDKAHAG